MIIVLLRGFVNKKHYFVRRACWDRALWRVKKAAAARADGDKSWAPACPAFVDCLSACVGAFCPTENCRTRSIAPSKVEEVGFLPAKGKALYFFNFIILPKIR
jgi:hypothetical protein